MQTRTASCSSPLADVRSIEFGLRVPPEAAKRMAAAVANLGDDDFQTRVKASADLLELKELAWNTVLELTKHADHEVAHRAAEIKEKLLGQLTDEQRSLRSYDIIRTDAFTIHGNIVGSALKARSPYFGDVEVQLANLRHYRRMRVGDMDREVVVDAAKYGLQQPRRWLDTGIELGRRYRYADSCDGRGRPQSWCSGQCARFKSRGRVAMSSGPTTAWKRIPPACWWAVSARRGLNLWSATNTRGSRRTRASST